jgi:hypothetical protein
MGPLNREMDADAFARAAEAQRSLIEVRSGELGSMTAERWSQLAGQLKELGLIQQAQPAERYFASF